MSITSDTSVQDTIANPVFRDLVDKHRKLLIKSRLMRPLPEAGFRYKKDWYDRMNRENMLSQKFFIENIESIWLKKSNLNLEVRQVVRNVCDKALMEMILVAQKAAAQKVTTNEEK